MRDSKCSGMFEVFKVEVTLLGKELIRRLIFWESPERCAVFMGIITWYRSLLLVMDPSPREKIPWLLRASDVWTGFVDLLGSATMLNWSEVRVASDIIRAIVVRRMVVIMDIDIVTSNTYI